MVKTIGEKIADEIQNGLSRRIIDELRKKPIENSLVIFDILHEKPEAVDIYAFDPRNIMVLWKRFDLPDAIIRAESEENVEKLADFVSDVKCTFNVPQGLDGFLEKRNDLKKENLLLYTTDRGIFRKSLNHNVEELKPEQENVKQIASQWKYFKGTDFIAEKMNRYPFYGIRVNGRLVSYAGILAHTNDVYFGGFARTDENFRNKGMMKSVTSALTERTFRDDKVPAMYIVEDNVPSRKSVEKLGFHRIATHARFFPV